MSVRITFIPCFIFAIFIHHIVSCVKVDVEKTQVWGPGLNENANLPVRYFYIQAKDKKGNDITSDLGDRAFVFVLSNGQGTLQGHRRELINRHDGSYIGRFRLKQYKGPLYITITHNGKHVAQSPYKLQNVKSDECNCPMDMESWMKDVECPDSFQQIQDDLAPHPTIPLEGMHRRMLDKFPSKSWCHYAIRNNKIYRECNSDITDFKMFSDSVLTLLARKVHLPDMELWWNLGDWPLENGAGGDILPMISWCGDSERTKDMLLPTWYLTRATVKMMNGVIPDVFSIQGRTGPKWSKKEPVGFFRGRDSRQERLDLATMSHASKKEYIDAAITQYFFFNPDAEKHGPKVDHISFEEFFERKYQINVDGTVAAYRFPFLMVGDSLVLKQDSKFYEHFYREMKPWEHYVPLKKDLTDAEEKVKWARENDAEARKIAQAGRNLARELVTPGNVFCYHLQFFKEYAARQVGKVKVLKRMDPVVMDPSPCDCKSRKQKAAEKKKHGSERAKGKKDEL